MPFIHQRDLHNLFSVQLWRLTESVALLKHLVSESDISLDGWDENWSCRRKREWLATRLLLQRWGISGLSYQGDGKPYCVGDTRVYSVSHSTEMVAVGRTELPFFGIDIERIDPRVLRLLPKYASSEEQLPGRQSEAHATLIWAAKEAVFKAVPEAGIDFKSMLAVNLQGDISAPEASVVFRREATLREFRIHYFNYSDHFLACAVPI
jgi:4'-phosphopantetheinyl transferase EntD